MDCSSVRDFDEGKGSEDEYSGLCELQENIFCFSLQEFVQLTAVFQTPLRKTCLVPFSQGFPPRL